MEPSAAAPRSRAHPLWDPHTTTHLSFSRSSSSANPLLDRSQTYLLDKSAAQLLLCEKSPLLRMNPISSEIETRHLPDSSLGAYVSTIQEEGS